MIFHEVLNIIKYHQSLLQVHLDTVHKLIKDIQFLLTKKLGGYFQNPGASIVASPDVWVRVVKGMTSEDAGL